MSVPIAQVVRSGFVEGTHYGSAVVVDSKGEVIWSVGDVGTTFLPRSANKFMQTLAMIELGLPLQDELLALACSSHSGEDFHISGVRQILKLANSEAVELQCPADYPLDWIAKESLIRDAVPRAPIYMNCSGKHAAMLLTCEITGWDKNTYRNFDHPLQHKCAEVIARCTQEPVQVTGVDGCGAPVMSSTLTGLARSFSKFAGPSATDDQRMIANAIKMYPEYVAGTTRDVTKLLKGMPGVIAKDGAEGVYAVGLGDGRALAIKIDDGAQRARIVVAMTILRDILGVVSKEVDAQLTNQVVLGGGEPVGEIVALIS